MRFVLALIATLLAAPPVATANTDLVKEGLSSVETAPECFGFTRWIAATDVNGDRFWLLKNHSIEDYSTFWVNQILSEGQKYTSNFFMITDEALAILQAGQLEQGRSIDLEDLFAEAEACAATWRTITENDAFQERVTPLVHLLYAAQRAGRDGADFDTSALKDRGYTPTRLGLQTLVEHLENSRTIRALRVEHWDAMTREDPAITLEEHARFVGEVYRSQGKNRSVAKVFDRAYFKRAKTTKRRLQREHGKKAVRAALYEARTGKEWREITAEERRRRTAEVKRRLAQQDQRLMMEYLGKVDPAETRRIGAPGSITPEDVTAALVVIMQRDMKPEYLTNNGGRLVHPDRGLVGATGVSEVSKLTCTFSTPKSARCDFVAPSFTSIDWRKTVGGTPAVTALFQTFDVNAKRVYEYEKIGLDFGDKGWRITDIGGDDVTRLVIGELSETPSNDYRPCVAFSAVDILMNC